MDRRIRPLLAAVRTSLAPTAPQSLSGRLRWRRPASKKPTPVGPDSFAVIPNTTTSSETGGTGTDTQNSNSTRLEGRVANKGAEGLAITPDGRTLAVMLQSSLLQDGGTGPNGAYTRMVTIDIASGAVKAQYAYPLTAIKPGKYTTNSELLVTKHTLYVSTDNDFLASFVLDDDLQTDVHDNPTKIFVFDFDQSDLTGLGTANTAQSRGWQYVPQPLVSEQMPDYGSPEQFPSFLFGLPGADSQGHGGFGSF